MTGTTITNYLLVGALIGLGFAVLGVAVVLVGAWMNIDRYDEEGGGGDK